jgi:drug/metabolite transporter (DMT)-like permease/uncharacterized protein YjiS (DUF1127 family)
MPPGPVNAALASVDSALLTRVGSEVAFCSPELHRMDRLLTGSLRKGSSSPTSKAPAALFAGIVAITLFALTPSTTRLAVRQVDGVDIGLSRTLGAGAVAIVLIVLLRIPPPQDRAQRRGLGLFALGCFILFPLLFSVGTQRTSATHASLIMASMPMVTSGLGLVLNRQVPGTSWLAGAALALFGEVVLIVATNGTPSAQPTVGGDLTVLISCISFCIGAVAGSRTAARMGAWKATFWAVGVSAIALLPVSLAKGITISIATITPITWLALLHLSLGASLIACIAWSFALEHGGIPRVAPLQFLQPVLALAFTAALLGEALGAVTLSCSGAILIGLVIMWRNAPGRPPASAASVGGSTSIRSLAKSCRSFIARRRSLRELSSMDYSQIKDLGFPPEIDEGRAPWRRN